MSGITKGMFLVLMFLYIVSPIDLCPGPIDDLIVLPIKLFREYPEVLERYRERYKYLMVEL